MRKFWHLEVTYSYIYIYIQVSEVMGVTPPKSSKYIQVMDDNDLAPFRGCHRWFSAHVLTNPQISPGDHRAKQNRSFFLKRSFGMTEKWESFWHHWWDNGIPKSIESIGVFLWQEQLCFQGLKMPKTCSMAFDSCHGIRCSKISWSCSSTWTNGKKKKWESTGSGFVADIYIYMLISFFRCWFWWDHLELSLRVCLRKKWCDTWLSPLRCPGHVGTKGNKHGMLPVSRLKELRWC